MRRMRARCLLSIQFNAKCYSVLPADFVDVFYDKFMNQILDVIACDKAINPK